MRYFALYKPFNMLSQFTREGNRQVLADLPFKFPSDVYPLGRLDADSEGLLLLTNDKSVNSLLLDPKQGHNRVYLVQVEGDFNESAKNRLENGVRISVNGKEFYTGKSHVEILHEPPAVPERLPPIRFRMSVADSWIRLTLKEGKNRQVRKMTAAAGYPTLRLIRTAIEGLNLGDMKPGDVVEIEKRHFYSQLGLKRY